MLWVRTGGGGDTVQRVEGGPQCTWFGGEGGDVVFATGCHGSGRSGAHGSVGAAEKDFFLPHPDCHVPQTTPEWFVHVITWEEGGGGTALCMTNEG